LPFQVATNLRQTFMSMVDRRNFRLENEALRKRVAELETSERMLEIQLERLELLINVKQHQSPGAQLTAPVTGISPGEVIREITLGKGQLAGVKPDMPVTTPYGLVGLVTDVLPRSSRVRLITDIQSRVGVSVREKGGQGVAVGIPGGKLRIVNFLEDDPVQLGDLIETSSRGGFFPRGIAVGKVVEGPFRDPNDLRIEFVVEPLVDIPTLLEVVLIEPQ
jgi:rod shape-determining protein MreC